MFGPNAPAIEIVWDYVLGLGDLRAEHQGWGQVVCPPSSGSAVAVWSGWFPGREGGKRYFLATNSLNILRCDLYYSGHGYQVQILKNKPFLSIRMD